MNRFDNAQSLRRSVDEESGRASRCRRLPAPGRSRPFRRWNHPPTRIEQRDYQLTIRQGDSDSPAASSPRRVCRDVSRDAGPICCKRAALPLHAPLPRSGSPAPPTLIVTSGRTDGRRPVDSGCAGSCLSASILLHADRPVRRLPLSNSSRRWYELWSGAGCRSSASSYDPSWNLASRARFGRRWSEAPITVRRGQTSQWTWWISASARLEADGCVQCRHEKAFRSVTSTSHWQMR